MTDAQRSAGQRAERRVFEALELLPTPWLFFQTVEWRALQRDCEFVGEADVIVFHPQHGLVVFEIKAGSVDIREGVWYYSSGLKMQLSPFSQARRSRYALIEKLRKRLGKQTADGLTVTHAVWFPDLIWRAPLPNIEAPSKAFLLDRQSLTDPESALLHLFREAEPNPLLWTRSQQLALKELLAPDCRQQVPLATHVDDTLLALHTATNQQLTVLRMLRSQSRLLIEGGAGTGKTLLACALAREHAALGRSVLLTCFNRQLALQLADSLVGIPGIDIANFHELVKQQAEAFGLAFVVPDDPQARASFFTDGAAELLLDAAQLSSRKFDSIIVDEAADFAPTWWLALEELGQPGFSWYCFYDRRQSIYREEANWHPPFIAEPMTLDINLRNPRAIGEYAARLGGCVMPEQFQVQSLVSPEIITSPSFAEMAAHLRELLRKLLRRESIIPEQVVVLAPYRHTNLKSGWSLGLNEVDLSIELAIPQKGKVRVGTIQGFKGLEADVIILAGLDSSAVQHPEWLYVGASRARAALYVLALDSAKLPQINFE